MSGVCACVGEILRGGIGLGECVPGTGGSVLHPVLGSGLLGMWGLGNTVVVSVQPYSWLGSCEVTADMDKNMSMCLAVWPATMSFWMEVSWAEWWRRMDWMEAISSAESSSKSFASEVSLLLLSKDDGAFSSDIEATPKDISKSWMSCTVLDVVGMWLFKNFGVLGEEIRFCFFTVASSLGACKAVW
eukprot:15359418-Ditylum_brightwellii.AAC.1